MKEIKITKESQTPESPNYFGLTRSQRSLAMTGGRRAFTLAETLIALVILGIIAAVTIPTLIRNHVDNANRAKVKKAMAMYEKALNNMIIENDLRSTDAIKTFGGLPEGEDANINDCEDTVKYFKTVEGGNCRFKTADGVWWDITDITNPIIILKSDYKEYPLTGDDDTALQTLAQGADKFVYGMVGRYEDDKGILRINDNAYEDQHGSTAQKAEVAKLWNFINKTNTNGDGDEIITGKSCEYNEDGDYYNCLVYGSNNRELASLTFCPGEDLNGCELDGNNGYGSDCGYSEDRNAFVCANVSFTGGEDAHNCKYKNGSFSDCREENSQNESGCSGGECSITYDNGRATGSECEGNDISSCKFQEYYSTDSNGNELLIRSYNNDLWGWEYFEYDDEGNQTRHGYDCDGSIDNCRCYNYDDCFD